MNITQVLNRLAYPKAGDNARRKPTDLYDEVTLATGSTQYVFFNQTLGNLFARNKKFPISGSEIFFAFGLKFFLKTNINTVALYNSLQNLILHSCIRIIVNDRLQMQLPLLEVLNFNYANSVGNDTQNFNSRQRKAGYTWFFPPIFNSNSSVQINFITNGTAATDFNNVVLRCEFSGIQFDKLDQFVYEAQADQALQDLDYIAYDVNTILTANQTDYNLFVQDSTKPVTDQSIYFPLPYNQRFQINAMKLYFFGDDADTDLLNLLIDARGKNILSINVDDIQFFQASIYEMLSVSSIRGSTFSDAGPVNTDYVDMEFIWREKVVKVPLIIPATATQNIVLSQPALSLSVNNEFMTIFKGFIKRQVA